MKDLIEYPLAKLAHEKGYHLRHRYMYDRNNELQLTPSIKEVLQQGGGIKELKAPPQTFAPTQSQLQRWLREEHFIDVFIIDSIKEECYDWEIRIADVDKKIECDQYYHNYEAALEDGLMEAVNKIEL